MQAMSEADQNEFQALQYTYRNMPYNTGRITATRDALALAQQLDASTRLGVLYDLALAYAVGDDPAKALPVCAEFFALLEECPTYRRGRVEATRTAMVAFFVALSLPQIPLEQCRVLLEELHRQVKKYGVGERIWLMYACAFNIDIGDAPAAEAYLQEFYRTPRDQISECAACEASNIAECLLNLGHRKKALALLKPVLEGSLTCLDQPWSALSILIHDALDHHEVEDAKALGLLLRRKKLQKKGDLLCAGALLRLQAYEQPEQWLSLLEKGIRWSIGMWDQRLLFNFYQGAWVFCAELSAKNPTVALSLPKKFSCWRADGLYNSADLAQWFYVQMGEIACRFDRRNGSDRFSKQIQPFSLPDGVDKIALQNSGAEREVQA